ncbi:RNA polymerase II transcriptional coactivator KELP [Glycine max]|nr:RNA polymerase II transcriptional coactivator KELP [Glycine max]
MDTTKSHNTCHGILSLNKSTKPCSRIKAETRRKVEEMVLDILKKSNIKEATEFTIRVAASERLGIDLSDTASKHFVRSVVESFLLSVAANEKSKDAEKKKENEDIAAKNDDVAKKEDVVVANEEESRETEVLPKLKRDDPERVICHLSNRRNVAVKDFKGTTLVSIREFYMKDGKPLPGSKGISLSSEQWSTFKKSVPAIEEAIKKMEERIGSEPNGKQNGDVSNSVVDVAYLEPNSKQKGDASNSVVDVATLEPHGKQNGDASNSVVDVAPLEPHGKQNGDASNSVVDVAPLEPVVPIEVIRFDGKNFQFWAPQMELLLKQLKIDYVLDEPCPNPTLGKSAKAEDIAATKAAERRWLNDDLTCQRNILSHLSDPLYNLYANRKMSAKDLWEELKLVYLYEEFGTKRSQVKKYLEFQMVEEKAVIEQIRELNGIADSIAAAGIFIDDNFHVSAIISKLPPSWKDFCIKLMREEYLPYRKLMERIQIEEEYRYGVKRVVEYSYSMGGYHQAYKGGHRRADYKPALGMCRNRPEIIARSVPCTVCGKRGHLSKHCWRRNDRQTNERKSEEDVRIPTEVDTQGATQ